MEFGGGNIGRPDRQCTAFRHRVAGVDGQIGDNLLELALIDLHIAKIAAMDDFKLDRRAE